MKSAEGKTLVCRKPKKDLGRFGFSKRIAPPLESTNASQMMRIDRSVHHVCLMRPAELVVTYHEGQKPFSENLHYAGVFQADPALDQVYADAEPPTHDAWNAESLHSPDRTFVNTTFTRIKEALNSFDLQGTGLAGGSAKVALGAASVQFASLLAGGWGLGGATAYRATGDTNPLPEEPRSSAPREEIVEDWSGTDDRAANDITTSISRPAPKLKDPDDTFAESYANPLPAHGVGTDGASSTSPSRTPPPSRVRPTRRPTVEYVGDPYFAERSGFSVLIQEFRVPVPGPQRLRAVLEVALTGATRETDPPMGADMPTLIGWEGTTGDLRTEPTPVVEGGGGQILKTVVRPAPDTVTLISIVPEEVHVQ
jgi:hypothetical protein